MVHHEQDFSEKNTPDNDCPPFNRLDQEKPQGCAHCGIKDCPSRGMLDIPEEKRLSGNHMVAATVCVFILPILFTAAGAALGNYLYTGTSKLTVSLAEGAGAVTGAILGWIFARCIISVTIKHKCSTGFSENETD